MGEVIRPQQFWAKHWAKHKAMRMAAWQIANKRAMDAGESRPEAVQAAYEELKRHLREISP